MTREIDYDELDQAVTDAMGTDRDEEQNLQDSVSRARVEEGLLAPTSSPTAATATREDGLARERAPEDSDPEVLARKPIKPRGMYIDMIPRKKRPALKPAPTKVEHTTEFGVISDEIPAKTHKIPASSATDFIAEPTPIDPEILDHEPEESDPENYTMGGGRSPFIENAIVDKRPLGDDIPASNTRAVDSTKNVYSSRLVTTRDILEEPITHEIVPDKKRSGIARFFLVLLIIAIGAGIGAGAWYLISSGIISL